MVKEVQIDRKSSFFNETKYIEIPEKDIYQHCNDYGSVYKDVKTDKDYTAKSVIDINQPCDNCKIAWTTHKHMLVSDK